MLILNLQNAGVLTPALVPDFPYGKSGGGIPLKNAVCPTCGTGRILEVKEGVIGGTLVPLYLISIYR